MRSGSDKTDGVELTGDPLHPVRRATDNMASQAPREPDHPVSISEITARIKELFEQCPALGNVSIVGEISNFKHHLGKHMYFSMKDSGAELKCVFFAASNRTLQFTPKDGMEVVASGYVGVYPERGYYQLYVKSMRESGSGALFRKFEELKKRLIAEGLTDSARKRSLPAFPRRIGIVTSSESAGLRDILNVLGRRYPLAMVVIESVAVEGEGSASSIANGLKRMAESGRADVVIVGRGGGSIESLWGFNTEIVARAIVAMPVPVISAVGHETDTTIADLVADRRAATPTEAAELATPSIVDLAALLATHRARSLGCITRRLKMTGEHLTLIGRTLRSPERAIHLRLERIDRLWDKLNAAPANKVAAWESRLRGLASRVAACSPTKTVVAAETVIERALMRVRHAVERRRDRADRRFLLAGARLAGTDPTAILKRGYAIAMKNGKAVKSAADVTRGDKIDVKLHEGLLTTEVVDVQRESKEVKA